MGRARTSWWLVELFDPVRVREVMKVHITVFSVLHKRIVFALFGKFASPRDCRGNQQQNDNATQNNDLHVSVLGGHTRVYGTTSPHKARTTGKGALNHGT